MGESVRAQRITSPFSRAKGRDEVGSSAGEADEAPAEVPVVAEVGVAEASAVAVDDEVELLELRPATLLHRELRAMTGFEEELVEDANARLERGAGDTASVCNELLARCLTQVGREPTGERARVLALSVAERDLALVALRRLSYGDAVEMLVDCPSCGVANEVDFDLAQLPLALDPIPARVRLRLADGREAELRLPSAGDQAELLASGVESIARRRSWMLARVLVRLGERSGPFSVDELHGLPVALRRSLERALAQALPDLDLGTDLRCFQCGHEWSSPLDIESFFLLS